MLGGARMAPADTPSGGVVTPSQVGRGNGSGAPAAKASPSPSPRPTAIPEPAEILRPTASQPPSPERMLAIAQDKMGAGADPQRLLGVAIAYRDKWARLVEEQESGAELDGRASIYTGETYAEARDRWEAYRVLLVDELGGTHGGC